MTQLSYLEMSFDAGGRVKDALAVGCGVIVAGEGVYWIGAASQWWNPVGWVSTGLAVASAACGIWGAYEVYNYFTQ